MDEGSSWSLLCLGQQAATPLLCHFNSYYGGITNGAPSLHTRTLMTMAKWLSLWPCLIDSSFFGGYPNIGIHVIYSTDTFGRRHSWIVKFVVIVSINWEWSATKSVVSGRCPHDQVSFLSHDRALVPSCCSDLCENQSPATD